MMLKCQARFVEKIWGDFKLAEKYGQRKKIGEVWLCSDYPGMRTKLFDSQGKTHSWKDVRRSWSYERFPFLVKHIKATQWLSVQVHPNDEAAKKVGEPWGKPEIWIFLKEGRIVNGLKAGALQEIKRGNDDWNSLLNFVDVKVGEAVYIEPGTVHAMGPGVEVYEFQLTSDMTYRFYDWGRGRKLHFKEALSVATENIALPFKFKNFSCEHFSLRRMRGNELKRTVDKGVYLLEEGVFDNWKCEVPTAFVSTCEEEVEVDGEFFAMEVAQ